MLAAVRSISQRAMTTSSLLKQGRKDVNVAFIGLGAMGYGMAANLSRLPRSCSDGHKHIMENEHDGNSSSSPAVQEEQQKQNPVFVWNRHSSVAKQHASEFGTRDVSSLEELGHCSIVFMCLPTSHEVEAVCQRLSHILPPNAIVADCTSGDPLMTRRIASSLALRQIQMVDCPVSGGPAGAKSGQLTSMMGGPLEAVSAVEPYLRRMAQKNVVPVGSIGAGHAVKAVNNTLNAAHLVIASEGLLALANFGISPEVALEAINGSSGRSLQTQERIPKEVLSREFDYGFPLGLMLKDVTIAVDSIGSSCTRTKHNSSCGNANAGGKDEVEVEQIPKFFPLVKDILQKAVNLESKEADYSRVVRPLEAEAGLELHAGSGVDGNYEAPSYKSSNT